MANVTLNVTDGKGQATGSVEAPAELFGHTADEVQAHVPLIHQVVVAQLAAARQGTHATKTRGMVSGGGKKPWKQKGTGRACQGSIRAPQWYHGGTVFGPQPRDYSQRTPKKMKAAAALAPAFSINCAISTQLICFISYPIRILTVTGTLTASTTAFTIS